MNQISNGYETESSDAWTSDDGVLEIDVLSRLAGDEYIPLSLSPPLSPPLSPSGSEETDGVNDRRYFFNSSEPVLRQLDDEEPYDMGDQSDFLRVTDGDSFSVRCEIDMDRTSTLMQEWTFVDYAPVDNIKPGTYVELRHSEREMMVDLKLVSPALIRCRQLSFGIKQNIENRSTSAVALFGPPRYVPVAADPFLFLGEMRAADTDLIGAEQGLMPQAILEFCYGSLILHRDEMMVASNESLLFRTPGRPIIYASRSVNNAIEAMATLFAADCMSTVVYTRPETMHIWKERFPGAFVCFPTLESVINAERVIVDDIVYWEGHIEFGTSRQQWGIVYEGDNLSQYPNAMVIREDGVTDKWPEHTMNHTNVGPWVMHKNGIRDFMKRMKEKGLLETPEDYRKAVTRVRKAFLGDPYIIGKALPVPDSCAVCMIDATDTVSLANEVPVPAGVRVEACGHTFHTSCMRQWERTMYNARCPLCRSTVQLDTGIYDIGLPLPVDTHVGPYLLYITYVPPDMFLQRAPYMRLFEMYCYRGTGTEIVLDGVFIENSLYRSEIVKIVLMMIGVDLTRQPMKFRQVVRSHFDADWKHYTWVT